MSGTADDSIISLGRNLYSKWKRDDSASRRLRTEKATAYVVEHAMARLYLRHADEVGVDVRVRGRPIIRNDGQLSIGDHSVLRSIVAPIEIGIGSGATMSFGVSAHVNSGATLAAMERVEIGDRVEVSPYVTIYDTSFHDLYERNRVPDPRPVIIEDDVWLGTKCTVLPGVRIGRGAVVVAHALVTRNVAPFAVVSGVPAKQVAQLDPTKFIVGQAE
jgi:serine acetyltransferase